MHTLQNGLIQTCLLVTSTCLRKTREAAITLQQPSRWDACQKAAFAIAPKAAWELNVLAQRDFGLRQKISRLANT